MRLRFALLSLALLAGTPRAWARTNGAAPFEYIDLLVPQVVGELGHRTYDVHDGDRFAGTAALDKGYSVLGGVGMRAIFRSEHTGIRFGVEWSVGWGRLTDVGGPFSAYSTQTRGEVLTSLGYELPIGDWLVLHTATVIGVGIAKLDAISAGSGAAALVVGADGAASSPALHLDETSLRLGQQVGLHVHVSRSVALYADATLDYDGQWRVRAGFAFGRPVHRR